MYFLSLIYCVIVLSSSFWEGTCSLRAWLSGWVEWDGVRTVEQRKDWAVRQKRKCRMEENDSIGLGGGSKSSIHADAVLFISRFWINSMSRHWKIMPRMQHPHWTTLLNIMWRSHIIKGTGTIAQLSLLYLNCLLSWGGWSNKWALQGQTEEKSRMFKPLLLKNYSAEVNNQSAL